MKDKTKRLGFEKGVDEILAHPFFKDIDIKARKVIKKTTITPKTTPEEMQELEEKLIRGLEKDQEGRVPFKTVVDRLAPDFPLSIIGRKLTQLGFTKVKVKGKFNYSLAKYVYT